LLFPADPSEDKVTETWKKFADIKTYTRWSAGAKYSKKNPSGSYDDDGKLLSIHKDEAFGLISVNESKNCNKKFGLEMKKQLKIIDDKNAEAVNEAVRDGLNAPRIVKAKLTVGEQEVLRKTILKTDTKNKEKNIYNVVGQHNFLRLSSLAPPV
jgi:hypothetical protein